MDPGKVVITGAGFTKAICEDAPLITDAIGKTILHATESKVFHHHRLKSVYGAFIDYCRLYDPKNEKNFNLEGMFTKYWELKNNGSLSGEEHEYLINFGHFKMAYVSLLCHVVPTVGNIEDYNLDHSKAKYFKDKLGNYLKITLNHDLLLESIFNSFPEPCDHEHHIQHLHGAVNWNILNYEVTSSISQFGELENGEIIWQGPCGYSTSFDQEALIHPLPNKQESIFVIPDYKDKYDKMLCRIKEAKDIVVIGCNISENEKISNAIVDNQVLSSIVHVGYGKEEPAYMRGLGDNVKYVPGGFNKDCLDS